MFSSLEEAMNYLREQGIEQIELKLIDLVGRWHHISYPADQVTERFFQEGSPVCLDRLPGYDTRGAEDLIVIPDVSTAFIDPFHTHSTMAFLGDLRHGDGTPFERDPRHVAIKAEEYVQGLALGGVMTFSPELQFHLFDRVEFRSSTQGAYWSVESPGAGWGDDTGSTYRLRSSTAAMIDQPLDRFAEVREQIALTIRSSGILVKRHHHAPCKAGQSQIEIAFHTPVGTADAIARMKYLVKNSALAQGYMATFMPQPLASPAINTVTYQQDLTDGERSLFYDPAGRLELSEMGLGYIAGLLRHTPALMGFGNASTNSYRRFAHGAEVPIKLCYARGDRSAAVNVPGPARNQQEGRIEYRVPDASGNPYLTIAAQIMAGLAGIQGVYDAGAPGQGPDLPPTAETADGQSARTDGQSLTAAAPGGIPRQFPQAMAALSEDRGFLKRGGVFTDDIIDAWLELKLDDELAAVQCRPHPYEFDLYFDL